jgi:aryl-alcohol dehydrogenase-like predicted oxidoreductase
MRLSTELVQEERAISVIHTALTAGVTVLDTANAYCRDEHGIGGNERMIARALKTWSGDRTRIQVATKGGLLRRGRQWVPDGRAKALAAACEASREALGAGVIDLYQLHVVDPRTPFETSIRALARMLEHGWVREIGLCNVTVGHIAAARHLAPIATVQIELNPFNDTHLRNGVVEYCRDHDIRILASRPFGGDRHARVTRDGTLADLATRHGITPYQVVLAWLRDLPADITALPGPTRVATAAELGDVRRIVLSEEERRRLDTRFPAGRIVRVPRAKRRPRDDAEGDVVLLMGYPAAGKSTVARTYEEQGYRRLSRDAHGGRVADLVPVFEQGIVAGHRRWVVDNTSPSRAGRNLFIETAWRHGVPIRCVWVTTKKEEAQVNAVVRLVERYGHLPPPDELRVLNKRDPGAFGPAAQHRYERELEPPVVDEGFVRVDEHPFVRQPSVSEGRAVIIDADGTSGWIGADGRRAEDDAALKVRPRDVLQGYVDDGWVILAIAWRPGAGPGTPLEASLLAWFAQLRERLGLPMQFGHCPHEAGPPICWCRKPLPGLAIAFAIQQGVNLARSIVVGHSAADKGLARRLGASYREVGEFFGGDVRFRLGT